MPLPFIIAGAAAVALGVGAKKGLNGRQKHSEAGSIVDEAKKRYDLRKFTFEVQEKATQKSLEALGSKELSIGKRFSEFKTIADALLEQLDASGRSHLEINIPKHTLNEIERYSYQAIGVLGALATAGTGGAVAGFAVYGGVMMLGAASTGTAISSLAGVAATNATLAAIGGGSLAAGGLGMAGGTLILGGAVFAPIVAIGGWAYDKHGESALANARKIHREVNDAVDKLVKAEKMLLETRDYAIKVGDSLESIHKQFEAYFKHLKDIDQLIQDIRSRGINAKAEILKLGDSVLRLIHNGYALAAILVDLITTPLFQLKMADGEIVKDKDGVPVMATDADGLMILNSDVLDAKIDESRAEAAKVEPA